MMRQIIGGPTPSGTAPRSARIVNIIIVALMVSMFLFGLLLKESSMPVLIGAGCFIVLFTALAIRSVWHLPEHCRAGRRKGAPNGASPMIDPFYNFPTALDHTTHTPSSDTSWQAESTSSVEVTPSYDSSSSFDSSSSSFDSGSSSCGSSSNE